MKLMTSNELVNVELPALRDYVRRGLVRPTAKAADGRAYLWSEADAAEVYRVRDLEVVRVANRRQLAAVRGPRPASLAKA